MGYVASLEGSLLIPASVCVCVRVCVHVCVRVRIGIVLLR